MPFVTAAVPVVTAAVPVVTAAVPVPAAAAPDPVAAAMAEMLAGMLGVDQVAVDGHFFDDLGADSMLMARFCAQARKRDDLPSVSMKDVYRHPTVRGLVTALAPAPPVAGTTAAAPTAAVAAPAPIARAFAEVLADVLGVEQVSVDAHFFDDLGADSMVMARFCAKVRKRDDLPSVSMKDVYRHSTVRSLATALAGITDTATAATTSTTDTPHAANIATAAPTKPPTSKPAPLPEPVGKLQYALCGALQLLFFVGYSYLNVLVGIVSFEWVTAASGLVNAYLRAVVAGASIFLAMCSLPILVKWALIGRWKPRQIRIWSLAYFRFWLVRTLVTANPLVLFNGSPIYTLYLRALGAKIGRGVLILSNHVPVCTDLIRIGDGTVIRKDSFFTGYRALDGLIQTGPVTLGKNVLLGEKAVLDIDTSMGDGAQLGHASSLHAGQAVPAGRRWHGSPAEPTDVDYGLIVPPARNSSRGALYSIGQVLNLAVLYLPLVFGGVDILLSLPEVKALEGEALPEFTTVAFYLDALVVAVVLVFAPIVVGLLVALTVPRLLNMILEPDKAYPLYGVRYSFHRSIMRMTNSKFLMNLFGDSSYVVPYLLALGYKLRPVVQTGSNFASELKHDNPYLSSVGTGTVVASDLSIVNADYSNTSFRVSRTRIGANNFLGNIIAYPSQGKTGDNCLLGTKVLVPIDGEIRENVGLLGSPSFEIPRTVERDNRFNDLAGGDELGRRLTAKNRHNLITIALFLLARTFSMFVTTVIGFFAIDLYHSIGVPAVVLASFVVLLFTIFYGVLIERASTGFRPLRPKYCSIYDIDFWRTERFFKLEAQVSPIFNGTPFKSAILRMLGVRVGKRLFDDGASMAEKNLVTLGDNVTLNAGAWVQCHSQEDNAFKSDRISIGSDCTVGIGAMILYSVTMGDRSVLAPDSFLMKGEEIPADAWWGGNPATEISDSRDDQRGVLVVDADQILLAGSPDHTRHGRRPGDSSTTDLQAAAFSRLPGAELAEPRDPERPGVEGRVHCLMRMAAAAAPTALGTLILLALSGGVAVAMGAPTPSRSAEVAPALPAVELPATTPPPSAVPMPAPSVESTRKATSDSSLTRSRSVTPTPRRSSSGGAAQSTAAPTPASTTPPLKRRVSRADSTPATTTSRGATTSRPATSSTTTESTSDKTADDASTSTRSTTSTSS
jgi:non-ribosomal peptide synthetase-like protein